MGARFSTPYFTLVHFGVDGGGFKRGVAGEFLDVSDVGSALQEVGRAGVTQEVGPAFGDVGGADVITDEPAKVTLSSSGVDGKVIADAVAFVRMGSKN